MSKILILTILGATMLVTGIFLNIVTLAGADGADNSHIFTSDVEVFQPVTLAIGKPIFMTSLDGFHEVPAVSSTGSGTFSAELSSDETLLTYELSYSDLEGTTTNSARIHLGQLDVRGGVSAFLCGGGGKPACPTTSGTVTGTITAADVIGPTAQGIAAGEFSELVTALRSGMTYVSVSTNAHLLGEIRGQIG